MTVRAAPGAVISPAEMTPLPDAEIEQRLSGSAAGAGARARRSCASSKFDDFAAAIAFVNRVAELAEAANHHPDILVHGWNKVRLTLSTHSEGGLTDADFELAGADRRHCLTARLGPAASDHRPCYL